MGDGDMFGELYVDEHGYEMREIVRSFPTIEEFLGLR